MVYIKTQSTCLLVIARYVKSSVYMYRPSHKGLVITRTTPTGLRFTNWGSCVRDPSTHPLCEDRLHVRNNSGHHDLGSGNSILTWNRIVRRNSESGWKRNQESRSFSGSRENGMAKETSLLSFLCRRPSLGFLPSVRVFFGSLTHEVGSIRVMYKVGERILGAESYIGSSHRYYGRPHPFWLTSTLHESQRDLYSCTEILWYIKK